MLQILEAQNLSFGYPSSPPIIEHWNHSFFGGEMVAITGQSGRGKSTLLHLLGLMLRPSSGTVILNGLACAELSDARRAEQRASSYGFVFQDAALDSSRTVLDNILEPAIYAGAQRQTMTPRALRLLKRFGVNVAARRRPGQVSGGQAQRIALCRSLLMNPCVLLADEPTGNLDGYSASTVVDGLREHAETGAIVLVATHDPRLVELCDRQIQL